jgi:hypothetical protein
MKRKLDVRESLRSDVWESLTSSLSRSAGKSQIRCVGKSHIGRTVVSSLSSLLLTSGLLSIPVLVRAQNCVNFWVPPGQTRPVCFNGEISYQTGSNRVYLNTLPDGSDTYLLRNTVVRYGRGEGKFSVVNSGVVTVYRINCNKNVAQAISTTYRTANLGVDKPFQIKPNGELKTGVCPYLR